jgi:ATP-dependent DNA helicase RecQ
MTKLTLLKKHFGYESYRPGQEELIDAILSGRDALGIMPTGGGKSICYQMPALMAEGITLVISPLIALMKDQVDALNEVGIPSTFLNSTLSAGESRDRMEEILGDVYKLVYVAPERLLTDSFFTLCKHIKIDFVAIDEAHCISQWGHDFRPSYRGIPTFIGQLDKRPKIAAFTATATSFVIDEIKSLLGLESPFELIAGFDRPNLLYKVIKPTDKFRYLKNYLNNDFNEGSGIIYCATRKTVESLSAKLVEQGYSAGAYHGGMDSEMRNQIQEDFMMDQTRIMVATNAFGMGIDKPDVRFVIHYNMPKNMEAYYQEAGRGGRDGLQSDCFLMYSPADIVKQKLMIAQGEGTLERKKIQYENLQTLVNYCHTNSCLRNEIKAYFGEESDCDHCGSCGNCLDDSEFVDMTLEAQKVLSCVYRTGQRFGVNMVIQVLRGSKNKKILDWKLNQVSTYGIITDMSEGGLRELTMNLIARGYLHMTTDTYPIVQLTQTSRAVLKGQEQVLIRKERVDIKDKKKNKAHKRKTGLEVDGNLFNQLVDHRRIIAEDKGVPLYVIFHNSALEEMAYYMPRTREAFLDIKGVGEKKFDNYGQGFIKIIEAYIVDHKIDLTLIESRKQDMYEVEEDVSVKTRGPNKTTGDSGKDRYEQTFDCYQEGLTIKAMAERRGLTEGTIVKHLSKLQEKGETIDWMRFIDSDTKKEIQEAISVLGGVALKPIKEKVSDHISYTDIHIVLAMEV